MIFSSTGVLEGDFSFQLDDFEVPAVNFQGCNMSFLGLTMMGHPPVFGDL